VAKQVLTGGQIWYHEHRDPPDHLEPLQQAFSPPQGA
jgi:hypothetical protein